jgi:hypothetical protein
MKHKIHILILLDILIANFHLFFEGMKSNHRIFEVAKGDVQYFFLDSGQILRVLIAYGFLTYHAWKKTTFHLEQKLLLTLLSFSIFKDLVSYLYNGNTGTLFVSIGVFAIGVLTIQAIIYIKSKLNGT